ncbi:MAG TPA: GerMN domain-containing protein [Candidatus Avacidaminococcus intestinavium]|uniref:GerMN domain-containing protein n=1 Tax=Candidatus Avacidaminococcus intestinavium TaxID=2840684 RepID=A0A9D1MQS3_9FIRM|nr:GerMN domain-containing protein [Candidatus Avacidaminococcus intestinavium]
MKKRKIWALLLIVFAVLMGGCFNDEETKTEPVALKEQTFTVYRATEPFLTAEKITIEDNGKSPAENALKSLVETKAADDKMAASFPDGTKVLAVEVKEDTAYANFSKELLNIGGGSMHEIMLTGAIVNTLTEFPEIKQVQIMVDGKKIETLNGHLDLTDPLLRDESLLPKKK